MKSISALVLFLAAALNAAAIDPIYVAPDGSDANDGSKRHPFATLERARDQIRTIREGRGFPPEGISVVVREGRYAVAQTFALTKQDACASNAPIVFRAADGDRPVFSGGAKLKDFKVVTEGALLVRLPEEARGKVFECDLRACGATNLLPLKLGGAYSGRGSGTHPLNEVFFDGKPLTMARWPNDGFTKVAAINTNSAFVKKGRTGSKEGIFTYEGDRPARWQNEKDVWLYGYWFWDWADSYEKVAAIDMNDREIELEKPLHNYGFRKGQTFYAVNAFCEIDQPGEYVIDRERGVLFLWPPSNPNKAEVELSVCPERFVFLDNVSNVRFEGITWECGAGDGIASKNCSNVTIAGCTVRNFGGEGVQIDGVNCTVRSCDIFNMGRAGVHVSGGNRRTLSPGGNAVENCHIHDLARINHTYNPAVSVDGVGNRVSHNLLHDVGSSAIHVSGNDHVFEFNEVCRSVLESDDQGGVDIFGDPTFRGNVYRWNFFHHNGSAFGSARAEPKLGQAGIRFDDAISGQRVVENVFLRTSSGGTGFGAIQIHGGKDNVVESNLFADCNSAVTLSQWHSMARWREIVTNRLKAIDVPLYESRYPEMTRLFENLDTNFVRANLVVNCGKFIGRGRAATNGNIIVTNSAPIAMLLKRPDAPRIPFEEIGLARDEFRRKLPKDSIARLRSGEPASK